MLVIQDVQEAVVQGVLHHVQVVLQHVLHHVAMLVLHLVVVVLVHVQDIAILDVVVPAMVDAMVVVLHHVDHVEDHVLDHVLVLALHHVLLTVLAIVLVLVKVLITDQLLLLHLEVQAQKINLIRLKKYSSFLFKYLYMTIFQSFLLYKERSNINGLCKN